MPRGEVLGQPPAPAALGGGPGARARSGQLAGGLGPAADRRLQEGATVGGTNEDEGACSKQTCMEESS